MNILAFDTAMAACSIALVAVGEGPVSVLGHHYEARTRGHAEVLNGIIDQVMREAALTFDQVERIAVTIGPGTFTGVRIGVASARGMALALSVPCIGVTTLEAIAMAAASRWDHAENIGVAADARRGELYVQCFSPAMAALSEPAIMVPAAAAELFAGHGCAIVGTGMDVLGGTDEGSHLKSVRNVPVQPDALFVAQAAAARQASDAAPVPLYLRAPDAKLPAMSR